MENVYAFRIEMDSSWEIYTVEENGVGVLLSFSKQT